VIADVTLPGAAGAAAASEARSAAGGAENGGSCGGDVMLPGSIEEVTGADCEAGSAAAIHSPAMAARAAEM
jgi:hypothetical protein